MNEEELNNLRFALSYIENSTNDADTKRLCAFAQDRAKNVSFREFVRVFIKETVTISKEKR